jgi:hypothetical protein
MTAVPIAPLIPPRARPSSPEHGKPGPVRRLPVAVAPEVPAALRRRCGLRPGDRVLLTVFPAQDALAAYSFAVVD